MSTSCGPEARGRSLLDAIRRGHVVADGALGTELFDRGVPFEVCYEELAISRPELVISIHAAYVEAGAALIGTNSFGANRFRLARHGLADRVRAINVEAVRTARAAAGERAWVAGTIGPTGLVFEHISSDERARVLLAFREQADALVEGGADALLIETMRHPAEIALAVEAARLAAGTALPVLAQVSVDGALSMADGTGVAAMGARLVDLGCDAIGVNCSDGPASVLAAARLLVPIGAPVIASPSAGLPRREGDRFVYAVAPEHFGAVARQLFDLGVRVVGGCCGTTPDHVRRIAAAARVSSDRRAALPASG